MLVAMVLFGLTTVSLIGAAASNSSDTASDYDETTYDTYTPASSSEPTEGSDTDSSTSYSSATSTSSADTATTGQTTGYQPRPAGPHPVVATGNNPFHSADFGAVTTTCSLPPFSPDDASQETFYDAVAGCLNRTWEPALSTANMPTTPPMVITLSSGSAQTPCGTVTALDNSQYCSGNHTIYMNTQFMRDEEQLGNARGRYLDIMLHEYGHAVQELTGIMEAAWEQRYTAGTGSPAGLELSKRTELQASCFAGQALAGFWNGGGSFTDRTSRVALADAAHRGDWPNDGAPDNHGTSAHNGAWTEQGYRTNKTSACNTWLAAPGAVS